jgi:Predicted transcriptional regulator with C-terminal CBS domains
MSQMLHENFCHNVRRQRESLGLTQHDLAERLEVSRPYIAQVEGGRCVPTLDLVERFAEALGVSGHQLLLPPKKFSVAS